MTRTKVLALAAAVLALVAVAAVALTFVPRGAFTPTAAIGETAGQEYQAITMPDSSWKYGAQLFFEADRESSGNPVTVTSHTPDVCVPHGSTSSGLKLVAAGHCAFTLTQAGDGSYAETTLNVDHEVARRTLFVSVADASRPTNSPNPTFDPIYDGFVHGDTAAVVTTPPQFMLPPPGVAPGSYPIVPYGAVAANYVFDYTPGTLTVTATMPNPTY